MYMYDAVPFLLLVRVDMNKYPNLAKVLWYQAILVRMTEFKALERKRSTR